MLVLTQGGTSWAANRSAGLETSDSRPPSTSLREDAQGTARPSPLTDDRERAFKGKSLPLKPIHRIRPRPYPALSVSAAFEAEEYDRGLGEYLRHKSDERGSRWFSMALINGEWHGIPKVSGMLS